MSREEVLSEVRGIIARKRRIQVNQIPERLRLTRGAANDVAVVLISRGFKVTLPREQGLIPLERFVDGISVRVET